ncbi:hypothetical protein CCAX7_60930 [Capsulimonas corticalis]|uniref:Uncharacterized protein n=2 Tax=Capsulimonas corticalis TaxID=2219043 RepID=A0A402CW27_9BACT|nr:hypothetical protein CCAX7_60930 [Capsulimonas corticalis]
MVIAEMYEKFHITPKDDDRLSCEATGQDVLVFRAMTLKEYIAAGQCHKLEWLFVGGTGGAQEC